MALLLCAIVQSVLVVAFTNIAMAHYNQLDVIPAYESMGLSMTIIAGMVFFDEKRFYTDIQLC
jgi:multidrug transporter EmrE-like cation transporter